VRPLRVTVCELSDARTQFATDWDRLVDHAREERSQLIVLPEMPFSPWLAASSVFEQADWDAAVVSHDEWLARLNNLAPASVLSSRPVTRQGRRFNEGFAWSPDGGYRAIHDKRYLPDEAAYWEAHWYGPGDGSFDVVDVGGAKVGMMICTDLWSLGHAEQYGKDGAEIIATPRATPRSTVEKWLAGGRVAAVVSGAFSLSSNWTADEDGGDFGGAGWIAEPDGDLLARTTRTEPFRTTTIDLDVADAAKGTYPRYSLR
jgi:N-carbamoylputrescine amidase